MNSCYWGKTVIKLLNYTNSVYHFSNNGSETEKSGIKTSMLAREHVSAQSTLARKHVSAQGTLARKHACTLARENASTQGTLAREHVSTQGTLTREHISLRREHVFSTQGTQFSRLIYHISYLQCTNEKNEWKFCADRRFLKETYCSSKL